MAALALFAIAIVQVISIAWHLRGMWRCRTTARTMDALLEPLRERVASLKAALERDAIVVYPDDGVDKETLAMALLALPEVGLIRGMANEQES